MKQLENFDELKVYELKTLAKQCGHTNPSKLKRAELIEYIKQNPKKVSIKSKWKLGNTAKWIITVALAVTGIFLASKNSLQIKDLVKVNNEKIDQSRIDIPEEFYCHLEFTFDFPFDSIGTSFSDKENWFYQNVKFTHFNIDLATQDYTSEFYKSAVQIITKYRFDRNENRLYKDDTWLEQYHGLNFYDKKVKINLFRVKSSAIINEGGINSLEEFCGNQLMVRANIEFHKESNTTETPKLKISKGMIITPNGKSMNINPLSRDWAYSVNVREDSCWMNIVKSVVVDGNR